MMTNDAAGRLQKRELFNYLSGDRYVTVIFLIFLFFKIRIITGRMQKRSLFNVMAGDRYATVIFM